MMVERSKIKTVGDSIRALTDEELAKKLFELYRDIAESNDISVNWCDSKGDCAAAGEEEPDCTDEMHTSCILRWLRKPLEGRNVQSI